MFVSKKKYEALVEDYNSLEQDCRIQADSRHKFANALRYILKQETSAPNATMQRVLHAAKEALGE